MLNGKQPLDFKTSEPDQLKFEIDELVPQIPEKAMKTMNIII